MKFSKPSRFFTQANAVRCPVCQVEIEKNWNFCPNCGERIAKVSIGEIPNIIRRTI